MRISVVHKTTTNHLPMWTFRGRGPPSSTVPWFAHASGRARFSCVSVWAC